LISRSLVRSQHGPSQNPLEQADPGHLLFLGIRGVSQRCPNRNRVLWRSGRHVGGGGTPERHTSVARDCHCGPTPECPSTSHWAGCGHHDNSTNGCLCALNDYGVASGFRGGARAAGTASLAVRLVAIAVWAERVRSPGDGLTLAGDGSLARAQEPTDVPCEDVSELVGVVRYEVAGLRGERYGASVVADDAAERER